MTFTDDLTQARAALTMIQPKSFNAETPPEALAGNIIRGTAIHAQ